MGRPDGGRQQGRVAQSANSHLPQWIARLAPGRSDPEGNVADVLVAFRRRSLTTSLLSSSFSAPSNREAVVTREDRRPPTPRDPGTAKGGSAPSTYESRDRVEGAEDPEGVSPTVWVEIEFVTEGP